MIKMPLKPKYQKIYKQMIKEYGPKKGRQIFYASANKYGWQYDYASNRAKKQKSKKWKYG